jgi:uncharacterized protein
MKFNKDFRLTHAGLSATVSQNSNQFGLPSRPLDGMTFGRCACTTRAPAGLIVIIRNRVDIPLERDAAWRLLLDVRQVAACVPGAELEQVVDEHTFRGTMRVRLGPVVVKFAGTAQFHAIDQAAWTASLSAAGDDVNRRGSARATTRFNLVQTEEGSQVDIETDLQLAGMIAQYGRASGLITQLSQELLNEFSANLRAVIARSGTGSESSPAPASEVQAGDRVPSEVAGTRLLMRAVGGWIRGRKPT